jgi:hypothetical protein
MVVKPRSTAIAALALLGALACNSKPSPQLQARIDSLQQAANERDRVVQEMAQDARMISDISAELAKVQVKGKLNVASESPGQASRDSVVARVRYIATRLNANESQLRSSERRIRGLSSLSDSLRNTLTATIANYDSVVAAQRTQLVAFASQLDSLKGENTALAALNTALRDTVGDLTVRENTVYYVIGTKDELVKKGVLVEEGGKRFWVLGGRTIQPARTFDVGAFTRIDRLKDSVIALPAGEYTILTRQDAQFAAPFSVKGKKIAGGLKISQPERFWEPSRFLILLRS